MAPITSFLGGKIFGCYYGSPPPDVIALHGWGRDRSDFDWLAREGLRALVLDLPGFGKSPPPQEPWGSIEYADAVARVVRESLGTNPSFPGSGSNTARLSSSTEPEGHGLANVDQGRPVVVFGHSFGGRVALSLAERYPEMVAELLLAGVPLLRRSPPRVSLVYRGVRSLARRGLLPEKAMDWARQRYGSSDYRAASGIMREVLVRVINEDYTETMRKITVPVTVIAGTSDEVVPIDVVREASELFAHCRMVEIAGASHLDLTSQQVVRDLLVSAVQSLEARCNP